MHSFKGYLKMLLILLLTVGVACSCCSCATNSKAATSEEAGDLESDSLVDFEVVVDCDKALLNMTKCKSPGDDTYTVCKGYSIWLDDELSQQGVTRMEWLVTLFDALDIEPVDYSMNDYSRFFDKDYFDGSEYFITAIENNILSGYDTEFGPNEIATRQYVSTTLVNAVRYRTDYKLNCKDYKKIKDKKQAAASVYFDYLELDENGNFNPYNAITQEDVDRIYEQLKPLNTLKGKRILSFGDSIMHGDGNKGVGIADLLSEKYFMTAVDYSKGGSTFGYVKDREQISNQILTAIKKNETADIILINGGTNDTRKVEAGYISEGFDYGKNGRKEFAQGMEYALGLLQDNYPVTPVLFVRAHNMDQTTEEKEIQYGELSVEICEKWGVPVVDMYTDSDFNAHDEAIRTKYTVDTKQCPQGDSIHPNRQGYEEFYLPVMAPKIADIIAQ